MSSKKRSHKQKENHHHFASTATIAKQALEPQNENSTMIIHATGFNPQKSVRFLEIDTHLLNELRKREESKKSLTARPLAETRYKEHPAHTGSHRSIGRPDENKATDDARIESVSLTTVNSTRHSENARAATEGQFKLNPSLIKC